MVMTRRREARVAAPPPLPSLASLSWMLIVFCCLCLVAQAQEDLVMEMEMMEIAGGGGGGADADDAGSVTNATANATAQLLLEMERLEAERLRKEAAEEAEAERLRRRKQQLQEEANILRPKERDVLIKLYNETGGAATETTTGWFRQGAWLKDNVDHCQWEGITCNDPEYGLVTEIRLGRNNMIGSLKGDLAGSFKYLKHIDMHANQLEAMLSDSFRINHPNLRYVDLSKNKLQGSLSNKDSIHPGLVHLDLSGNELSGRFEPKFDLLKLCPPPPPPPPPCIVNVKIQNWTYLTSWPKHLMHCLKETLDTTNVTANSGIESNSTTGNNATMVLPIMSETCPANVAILNVTSWPKECKEMLPCPTNVAVLNLTSWPEHLLHCNETLALANLTSSDDGIGSNSTAGNNATGNVTDDLPTVPEPQPPCGPNLTHLAMSNNQLEFVNITYFTSLRHLDLSKNSILEQPLAALGIGNLKFLQNLILSQSKRLTGNLRIGHMSYLENLDLSGLELSGDIESTGITNLTTLRSIDLSDGNMLTGVFDYFCDMVYLKSLSLAGRNALSGNLTTCESLGSLEYLDLSDNNFSGRFQLLEGGSPIALRSVNLHRNSFTGALPPFHLMQSITSLHFGENLFSGTLPDLSMPALKDLNVSHNALTGSIPSTISNLAVLNILDLSNQAASVYDPSTGIRVTRGLTGQIPVEIGQVGFLQTLNLENNLLTGSMPDSLSLLTYLETINLEDNYIGGKIPPNINLLEQLGNVMLARNRLTGEIPDLGGSADVVRTVTMSGNPELLDPAPFQLCDLDDLDLRSDSTYCPAERSALATFYANNFGTEWLDNTNWLSEAHHCEWFGVTCDENNVRVLKLELVANGVAGRIPDALFNLKHLQHLDLNDNDLRGEIPASIVELKDLRYLRLSYNRLTQLPDSISNLTNLALVHLHNNRMEGDGSVIKLLPKSDIPKDYFETLPPHRFISDCGDPQDVSDAFVCVECDMCCNSLEECNEPFRQQFLPWQSTAILLASVFAALCVAWGVSRVLTARRILPEPKYNALEAAGEDSVYFFFLSGSKVSWLVAIATLLVQVAIFGIFLNAASFDNGDGDFVYSWRCPLNTPECNDERAVGAYGWVMWAFLVTVALIDDAINGCKLLLLSSMRGSMKCFISGLSLIGTSVLAVYSSYFYNAAIAQTNTELIVNAVILLFVNDFDEQVCGVVGLIKGRWLENIQEEASSYSEQIFHEHVRASMMTNFDKEDKEDDSIDDVKQTRGMSQSGARKLPKINGSSQEDIIQLLHSMQNRIDTQQNRIDVLEQNAGIWSPPASRAGDMEESDGPIKQGPGCIFQ